MQVTIKSIQEARNTFKSVIRQEDFGSYIREGSNHIVQCWGEGHAWKATVYVYEGSLSVYYTEYLDEHQTTGLEYYFVSADKKIVEKIKNQLVKCDEEYSIPF